MPTPTFPVLAKAQSAEAADCTVTLGLLSLRVDAVAQKRPNSANEGGTRLVCHFKHDQPMPLSQQYVCADGHSQTRSEALKAREMEDGTLVYITEEARSAAVTGGIPDKELALTPHPAADIDQWTRPEGTGFRVRLGKKASSLDRELYTVLLNLAADDDVALVGIMKTSGTRRLWRLTVWQGQLFLEARIETGNLAPPDDLDLPAVNDKLLAMARELRDELAEPFDPTVYAHDVKAAVDAAAAESAAEGGTAVGAVSASVEGLLDSLGDALAAKRAEKAAATKAAGKKTPARSKAKAS